MAHARVSYTLPRDRTTASRQRTHPDDRRYVNVRGGPDRRCKGDQTAVLTYGELTFALSGGLQSIWQFSRTGPVAAFVAAL
jgi:hypothetical protein